MKEVGIKYGDMSPTQQNSVIELKLWLHEMWSVYDVKSYYALYVWLVDIPKDEIRLSSKDLTMLWELWDVYELYKKEKQQDEGNNTEHNN